MIIRGEEARKLLAELGMLDDTKPNKYRNKKIIIDGIKFDSEKEANRYAQLRILLRAGEISELELQKNFVLIPTQRGADGKVIERAVKYIADFYYRDNRRNRYVVEDTKGVRTDDYVIKRKLMLYIHKLKIKEI